MTDVQAREGGDVGEAPRPYFQSSDVTIWHADAREAWQWLPEHSVNAVITSPPYYGLRDYGVEGQIGLEDDPQAYVDGLADLLTGYGERVLRADGSLWLNLGDTYAANRTYQVDQTKVQPSAVDKPMAVPDGWQAKCLLMIPERVALALIARGWILRNKIVWAKSNAMPSSARDRFTPSWEYLFLFVRQPRYYWDRDAVLEPLACPDAADGTRTFGGARKALNGKAGSAERLYGHNVYDADLAGRNPRDVWTIPTQALPDAHFAVFPPELVRRPILATVPEQVCRECGEPRERVVERASGFAAHRTYEQGTRGRRTGSADSGYRGIGYTRSEQVGWTNCGCEAGWRLGVVLDPFLGSGTTAHMARRLGRRAWGVELNADYCQMAADRFRQERLPL